MKTLLSIALVALVSLLVGAQNVQTATNVSTVGSGLFKDGSTMLSLSIIPSPIFPTIANSSVMNDTGSCLGEFDLSTTTVFVTPAPVTKTATMPPATLTMTLPTISPVGPESTATGLCFWAAEQILAPCTALVSATVSAKKSDAGSRRDNFLGDLFKYLKGFVSKDQTKLSSKGSINRRKINNSCTAATLTAIAGGIITVGLVVICLTSLLRGTPRGVILGASVFIAVFTCIWGLVAALGLPCM